jgi:CBS domain-containing protein
MDGGRLLRAMLALALPYRQATTIAAMVGQGLAILMVVVGLKSTFWLVLIGAFIFLGAEGEERVVRMRSVLRELNVGDVMSRGFASLSPSDPVSRGTELIYQTGQDDFPVLENGTLVGIVARSELIKAMNAHGPNTPVSAVMKADVTLASPQENLVHACEELINGTDTNAVIVVDDGRLVGMVSPENINRYLLLQSSIKSPRRQPRSVWGRRARGAPPRLVTSQTPAPPPVISGGPPIAAPQPPAGSVPPSGLA